jgi:hypothetical protein
MEKLTIDYAALHATNIRSVHFWVGKAIEAAQRKDKSLVENKAEAKRNLYAAMSALTAIAENTIYERE